MLSISQSNRLLHDAVYYTSTKVLVQHIASIYPCSVKHYSPSVVCLMCTTFQELTLLFMLYDRAGQLAALSHLNSFNNTINK